MAKVGKYELVRKLATGGMAEVYLAKFEWARGLEKTVVVKRILGHMAVDPNFVAMFLSEARLAAQLSHPNIAQIIEFDESDGVNFLAMEYVDGPSLRTLAAAFRNRGEPLPFPHCARIVACACEALAHAHELTDPATGQSLQLVHRDVSPDNVLISRTGAVKLVDFGIAKAVTQAHHTKTGTVKGKLSYMPPEQVRAQPLDRRADIYSLGVVLYELVAGTKPYGGANEIELIHSILYGGKAPLPSRRADAPPELERIINRAMERDRELRYSDCRVMHADLERFIITSQQPVSAFQIAELIQRSGLSDKNWGELPPRQAATPRVGSLADTVEPTPSGAPSTTSTEDRTDVSGEIPAAARGDPVPTPILPPPPSLKATRYSGGRSRAEGAREKKPPFLKRRIIAASAGLAAAIVVAVLLLQGEPVAQAISEEGPPPDLARTEASRPDPRRPPDEGPGKGTLAQQLLDAGAFRSAPRMAEASAPIPDPSDQDLFEEGKLFLKKRDFAEAQKLFLACLKVNAGNAECHLALGSTYARLRQPEEGAEHYREFLRLAPDSERAGDVRRLLENYESQKTAQE